MNEANTASESEGKQREKNDGCDDCRVEDVTLLFLQSADSGALPLHEGFDSNAIELLAKLEEANKALENDAKSSLLISSLSPSASDPALQPANGSRRPSITNPDRVSLSETSSTRSLNTPSPAVSTGLGQEISSSKSKFSFPTYLFTPRGAKRSGSDCKENNISPPNDGGKNGDGLVDGKTEGPDPSPEDPDKCWVTWGVLLTDWESQTSKNPTRIKELVYKGIPQPFRPMAWQLLSGALSASPCNSPLIKSTLYAEYLKRSSPYEKLIRRDINRTYPEHSFFKEKDSAGQESLFNVMKAYSLYDQEVGYCQGSCFIVGLLLMQMPEEEAFSVLIKIMHKYNLRKLFKPSMSELALCMYQLECLIQEYIPDLYHHFQANNFHTSMYASPWFLTLFSSTLPLETAFRIMDVFLIEGINVIFRISAAILFICRADLLVLDMEGMLQYIQKEMPARLGDDPDVIFALANNNVPFKEKQMRKVEKDFLSIKAKEQEELIQIKKLRQENRLLKQRVQYLEEESASLADRLIQGQVSRAVQAEEQFSIKRDFSELRKVLDEKDHTIKLALEQIQILKEQDVEKGNYISDRGRYEEMVVTLQQELLAIKYREAECLSTLDDLRRKYDIMESKNLSVKMSEVDIKYLNEQLINAKLKENEYVSVIKEFRTKMTELEGFWQQYLDWAQTNANGDSPFPANGLKINGLSTFPDLGLNDIQNALCKRDKKLLKDILTATMHLKMAESMSFAELKDLKGKESDLRNELAIKEEKFELANSSLSYYKEKFDEYSARDVDNKNKLKTMQCQVSDLQTQLREKEISLKLKETELMEKSSEFEGALMRLETERQENLLNSSLMDGSHQTTKHKKVSTDSSLSGFSEFDQEISPDAPGTADQNGPVPNFLSAQANGDSIFSQITTNTSDLTDTDSSSLVSFEESLFKTKLNKVKDIPIPETNSSKPPAPSPPSSSTCDYKDVQTLATES